MVQWPFPPFGQCLQETQAGSLNRIDADAELSFAVLKHCGLEL